jgi:hypothetical protein
MNRRGFLGALVGGVAIQAAERTWPFRVYSFASTPKVAPGYSTYIFGKESFVFTPTVSLAAGHVGFDSEYPYRFSYKMWMKP